MLKISEIKSAQPKSKRYRMSDGGGLYLEVTPSGSKIWRFRYRFDNKQRTMSLGKFPTVSLKQAREKRSRAQLQLADDIDPGSNVIRGRKFSDLANDWFDVMSQSWSAGHVKTVRFRLDAYILPALGSKPIKAVKTPDVLAMARDIENAGKNETARRIVAICGQVFRYGIASGQCETDPTQPLKGALAPVNKSHFAAVTEPHDVSALLRQLNGYDGSPVVAAALKLAPMVFVRPGELRKLEWCDIDGSVWTIPAAKTKTRNDLIVPLSRQAVAVLESIRPITGHGRYVFPSARHYVKGDRSMSDNAVLAAMRYLGIPKETMTGHGFRAMARTMLDEQLHYPVKIIELQLNHKVSDPLGRSYNRTKFIKQRTEMMQAWSDYLESLAADNVVSIKCD